MKPRVILLGNKNIAASCLKQLLSWQQDGLIELLALVANYGDDPNANNWYPSAKAFAIRHGIPVYQPRTVNKASMKEELKRLAPDVMVSAQYDRIIKDEVINIPRLGIINLHFAPLPKYRGVFPLVWALIDGEASGVTMHYIDPGIDTGDIIAQTILPIGPTDTARRLYMRASEAGIGLFRQNFLPFLRGETPRIPQNDSESSYYSVGYPYERWIDWSESVNQVDRFIRALTFEPYPSARTVFQGTEIEILYPVKPVVGPVRAVPGTILSVGNVIVAQASDGMLEMSGFRLENRVLSAEQLSHKLNISENDVFELCKWKN